VDGGNASSKYHTGSSSQVPAEYHIEIWCAQKSLDRQWNSFQRIKVCEMLCIFWYPTSVVISCTSTYEREVGRANGLILQGMKIRTFYDLKSRCKNWHKELPSVLWVLLTNINRTSRDIRFNLVYGAHAVLPTEIYLQLARVAHLNKKNQAEAKELDSNSLEERCNTTLANVRKY
jgi:hypothetical protein